jgi:carboxyl-terminal processing protease
MDPEEQMELRSSESSKLALNGRMVMLDDLDGRPVVKSVGGRNLYGGGGITPDISVPHDTLSSIEEEAVQGILRSTGSFTASLFNYAIKYIQDNPNLLGVVQLKDSELNLFYENLLKDSESRLERSTLESGRRFIKYQLEREIALRAWGPEGAFEQTWSTDSQILRALEVLERAKSPEQLVKATVSH